MPADTKSPPGKVEQSGGCSQEEVAKELPVQEAPTASSEPIDFRRDSVAGEHVTSQPAVGSHSFSSLYSGIGYQSTSDASAHEGPEFKSGMSVGGLGDIGSQDGAIETHSREGKLPWQHDTRDQEVLEAMLTNETPPGVFPRFPSWSLCRLGNASSYSPVKGLDLPGFFPSSNFLLSWDIPVLSESQSELTSQFDGQGANFGAKVTSEEAWPTLNESPSSAVSGGSLPLYQALSFARQHCANLKEQSPPVVTAAKGTPAGSARQRGKGPRDGGPPTVRAYLGDEYECPRGHR